MRGKVPDLTKAAGQAGITPAHAGKSRPLGVGRVRSWDHPRVCGEKASLNARIAVPSGSPPRMRGKDSLRNESAPLVGITPAYAGKSRRPPRCCPAAWDHPRVCGEKLRTAVFGLPLMGSPPHMRGKAAVQGWMRATERITPACAGKRRIAAKLQGRSGDHPRMCGEKACPARLCA